MRASFGPNGQLVKILPNRPTDGQPATIELHEVEAMLAENMESQELREFPGPLIRYAATCWKQYLTNPINFDIFKECCDYPKV